MPPTGTISSGVANGLAQVWHPLQEKANAWGGELNARVTSQHGRDLLNSLKSDFITSYQLSMTALLQLNADMPEWQIRSFAQKANTGLEAITQKLFDPDHPVKSTVKGQLKAAIKEMNVAMKTLTEVTRPQHWAKIACEANLGETFDEAYRVYKKASPIDYQRENLKVGEKFKIKALGYFMEQAHKIRDAPRVANKEVFNARMDVMYAKLDKYIDLLIHEKPIDARYFVQLMDNFVEKALDAVEKQYHDATAPHQEVPQPLLPERHKTPAPQFRQVTTNLEKGDQTSERKDVQLMMCESAVENLVFRGGGAKGRGYLKTLEVFQREHVFDNVKNIAGSSAGALTAVALGCGLGGKALEDFTTDISKGLKIGREALRKSSPKAYPGLDPIMYPRYVHEARAAGAVQAIDQMSATQVADFLTHREIKTREGELPLTDSELKRLQVLQQGYNSGVCRISDGTTCKTDPAITFKDISLLRRLEGGEQFKELFITAWSHDKRDTAILSAETVPNMPIALAARASMALPWFFTALRMNLAVYKDNPTPEELAQKPSRFSDGGIGMNLPVTVFIPRAGTNGDTRRLEEQKAKTMAFMFDEGGRTARGQAKNGPANTSIKNYFMGLFLPATTGFPVFGNNLYYKVKKENERIATLGNVAIVGHGDLETTTLSPTAVELEIADLVAEAQAESHVRLHKNEHWYITVNSPEDAVSHMDPKQMEAFCHKFENGGITKPTEFEQALNTLCLTRLEEFKKQKAETMQAFVQAENAKFSDALKDNLPLQATLAESAKPAFEALSKLYAMPEQKFAHDKFAAQLATAVRGHTDLLHQTDLPLFATHLVAVHFCNTLIRDTVAQKNLPDTARQDMLTAQLQKSEEAKILATFSNDSPEFKQAHEAVLRLIDEAVKASA